MAGYQTIEALRPILHRGPVPTPIVNRELVRPTKPKRRGPGAKVEHDDIAVMCAMRLAGDSLLKIGRKFGVAHTTVLRLTAHLPSPPGGWPKGRNKPRDRQAFAERLLRSGYSLAETRENTGMSKTVLSYIRSGRAPKPWVQTPLSRVVRALRDVTGIPAVQLRCSKNGGKASVDVARARYILFWIANKRVKLLQIDIARDLGGFDVKTVSRGVSQTRDIAERLAIPDDLSAGRIARLLWEAEWPKATA